MVAKVMKFSNYDDAEALQVTYLLPKHVLDKTAAPGVGDDDADGFVAGSEWVDRTNDKVYKCLDNATGAALWLELVSGGGGATWTESNHLSFIACIISPISKHD